jgi:uncharacterized membrane protein
MSHEPGPETKRASIDRPRAARPRCAICGNPARSPVVFGAIRPAVAALIQAEHPNLTTDSPICHDHVTAYRGRYVENMLASERTELSDLEREVVESLAREETISAHIEEQWLGKRSVGEKIADVVADFGGSWSFIICFFVVLMVWMAFNIWMAASAIFDPYPFILLNLVLSCLAAIQAPIIMMSQERQEAKDRLRSMNDYQVNLKAELEIRHLHEKLDHLVTKQWQRLAEIQQIQLEMMAEARRR